MAWETANAPKAQRIAQDAARRNGMTIDEWLDEAIREHAAHDQAGRPDRETSARAFGGRRERARRREWTTSGDAGPIPLVEDWRALAGQDLLEAAIQRIERGLARNAEETARALASIQLSVERANSSIKAQHPVESQPEAPRRPAEAQARPDQKIDAAADFPLRSETVPPNSERDDRASQQASDSQRSPNESEPALKLPAESARVDWKDALSQIALRRQELDARQTGDHPAHPTRAGFTLGKAGAGKEPESGRALGPSRTPGQAAYFEKDIEAPPREFNQSPGRAQASPSKASSDDIRALAAKLDAFSRAEAEPAATAAGIATMRAEIGQIRRSLADLAPRNAVVALEGAIRDLTQRVEVLRRNGHRETLLAPIDAMATELRATLKAHDPQAVAAALEREIRSIGGKIDSLARSAIEPGTVERIRTQTDEVRSLLAAAAMRAAPIERLERQIGELADRVERLGASPAPQVEIHQMTAALSDLRVEIERSTPLPTLVSIERRLERIASRLDEEIARPAEAAFDSRPFDDLARRIEDVRQTVEARSEPKRDTDRLEVSLNALNAKLESPFSEAVAGLMRDINAKLESVGHKDAATPLVEQLLGKIVDKLDRLAQSNTAPSAADMRPLEEALHSLDAKLDRAPALDRDAVERVADAVARRLPDRSSASVEPQALTEQLADIHDRLDALSRPSIRADALEPLVRELLVKLRDVGSAATAETTERAGLANLAAELSQMRAENAKTDRSTQSRLSSLQDVLEKLVERLSSPEGNAQNLESKPQAHVQDKASVGLAMAALRKGDAPHHAAHGGAKTVGRLDSAPAALTEALAVPPLSEEDFLLEPGVGIPKRAQDSRDAAQSAGARTNAGLSAHIAAARRAAQAALGDGGKADGSLAASPTAALGAREARPLYASRRRSLLLAVALTAVVITVAARLGGLRSPLLQKLEPDGQTAKSGAIAPSSGAFDLAGAKMDGRSVDTTPTSSISASPELAKPKGNDSPPAPELPPALPVGLPQALRDAAVGGVPSAQYETAQRLFEGRGVPQDQHAAALWFERAAATGLAPAQFRIGALYQKGIGVARDEDAAKRWYKKAADAGNARAAHNLAVMYAEPTDGKPDFVEAAKWFRKAAELGVRDSQFNLAVLYARGLGVERDLRQSWVWFSLASAQGDSDAGKKRDEVAAKMDPAELAAATEELSKLNVSKPDPAANEVVPSPGS
jgi:localization factor PodJL